MNTMADAMNKLAAATALAVEVQRTVDNAKRVHAWLIPHLQEQNAGAIGINALTIFFPDLTADQLSDAIFTLMHAGKCFIIEDTTHNEIYLAPIEKLERFKR